MKRKGTVITGNVTMNGAVVDGADPATADAVARALEAVERATRGSGAVVINDVTLTSED